MRLDLSAVSILSKTLKGTNGFGSNFQVVLPVPEFAGLSVRPQTPSGLGRAQGS